MNCEYCEKLAELTIRKHKKERNYDEDDIRERKKKGWYTGFSTPYEAVLNHHIENTHQNHEWVLSQ